MTCNILHGQNNALSFDGTDDYIEISNNTILGSSNMTLEMWVNPGVNKLEVQNIKLRGLSFCKIFMMLT